MNIPHLSLMRIYGTQEVFFQKAAGVNSVSACMAGEVLEGVRKLASAERSVLLSIGQAVGGGMAKQAFDIMAAKPAARVLTQFTPPVAAAAAKALPAVAKAAPAATPRLGLLASPADRRMAQAASGVPATQPMFGSGDSRLQAALKSESAGEKKPGFLASPADKRMAAAEHPQAHAAVPDMRQQGAPAAMAKAAPVEEQAAAVATPGKSHLVRNLALGGGALLAGAGALSAFKSGLNYLGAPNDEPANYGMSPGVHQVPMGVNRWNQPQPGSPLM